MAESLKVESDSTIRFFAPFCETAMIGLVDKRGIGQPDKKTGGKFRTNGKIVTLQKATDKIGKQSGVDCENSATYFSPPQFVNATKYNFNLFRKKVDFDNGIMQHIFNES